MLGIKTSWLRTLAGLSLILVIIVLLAMPVYVTVLLWHPIVTSGSLPPLSLDQLIATGGWVQAIIAWCTLVVALVAIIQLAFMRQQHLTDKQRAESEIYHQLIAPEMQSTKRFLNSPEVIEIMRTLIENVNEYHETTRGLGLDDRALRYDAIVEEFRDKLANAGETMSWPLLGSTKMSLDHVEFLINEYNYVATLMVYGVIDERFTRDLFRNNFLATYELIEPIVRLRRIRTPNFAGHLSRYYETHKTRRVAWPSPLTNQRAGNTTD
jgi:hypothetical protein